MLEQGIGSKGFLSHQEERVKKNSPSRFVQRGTLGVHGAENNHALAQPKAVN